jgi:hypothetical protein
MNSRKELVLKFTSDTVVTLLDDDGVIKPLSSHYISVR